MEVLGNIHSIESLGTVDGPGLRFIVFMQGCMLKCKFCHNRDTWEIGVGKKISADKLVNKILKYKTYFYASGGGVTFSGGEPLLQQDFLLEIIPKLKHHNIHVVIDTSGNFNLTSKIKQIIELTDMFLLDIKSINNEVTTNLCSFNNQLEIIFARYLSEINKPFWIRHVLVPGFTDNEKDLVELGKFIKELKSVEKVEIIPYHNFGQYKWENLGLTYPLKDTILA